MPLPKPSPKSPLAVRACFSRLRRNRTIRCCATKRRRRALYEAGAKEGEAARLDDAILRNERGEVTETWRRQYRRPIDARRRLDYAAARQRVVARRRARGALAAGEMQPGF